MALWCTESPVALQEEPAAMPIQSAKSGGGGLRLQLEREPSLMGDVRELMWWACEKAGEGTETHRSRSSYLLRSSSASRTPASSRRGGTVHCSFLCCSESAAAAAILAPILSEGTNFDSGPPDACCAVSFRGAVIAPIMLLIVLSAALMFWSLESSVATIRSKAMDACDDAMHFQKVAVHQLVYDNVTTAAFAGLVNSIGLMVEEFVRVPADRAVSSLWGTIRSNRVLNKSYDGRGPEEQAMLQYRSWVELDRQWDISARAQGSTLTLKPDSAVPQQRATDSLAVNFVTGETCGVAVSSSAIECPASGPSACGDCEGSCTQLSATYFAAPAGAHGNTLMSYLNVDLRKGVSVGPVLLSELQSWASLPAFAVQQQMAKLATSLPGGPGSVSALPLWSELHPFPQGYMKLSYTLPVAHCGDYSCFEGVVSADVVLREVSNDCYREWAQLQILLAGLYNFNIGPHNSSIFIVNHVSHNFPHQQGLLIGAADVSAINPLSTKPAAIISGNSRDNQAIVAATSRAILARFGAWNATELQKSDQLLTFRLSAAMQNRFEGCDFSDNEGSPASEIDCMELSTHSVKLDSRTRWLVIAALPAGAFNANAAATSQLVTSQIQQLEEDAQSEVNRARLVACLVFACVAIVSTGIGFLLGWFVTDPLQRLSSNMRSLGSVDVDSLDASFVNEIQQLKCSFLKLLKGMEASSRFVPQTVVARLLAGDRRAARLHVDRGCATIMFCSMGSLGGKGNFAQVCSSLTVDQTLRLVTQYMTAMVDVVARYEGTVAEILDDGLLVYWNVPNEVKHHALRACEAAVAQKRAAVALNAGLMAAGLPTLAPCIGIHSGTVLSGNIGSEMKMKLGCIGDAVNLASRLHGLCKHFSVDVICSEDAVRAISQDSGLLFRKLAEVQVVGKLMATPIFELVGRERRHPPASHQAQTREGAHGHDEHKEDWAEYATEQECTYARSFEAALGMFLEGRFGETLQRTRQLLKERPSDVAAQTLHVRAAKFADPASRPLDEETSSGASWRVTQMSAKE